MPSDISDSRAAAGRAETVGPSARRSAFSARLFKAIARLAAACRSRAALAMMSERELRDLGLLPWEVRSVFCR